MHPCPVVYPIPGFDPCPILFTPISRFLTRVRWISPPEIPFQPISRLSFVPLFTPVPLFNPMSRFEPCPFSFALTSGGLFTPCPVFGPCPACFTPMSCGYPVYPVLGPCPVCFYYHQGRHPEEVSHVADSWFRRRGRGVQRRCQGRN